MSLKEKGRRLLLCNRIEQQQLALVGEILATEHMRAHNHHGEKEAGDCDAEEALFKRAKSLLGQSRLRNEALKDADSSVKRDLEAVTAHISNFEDQTREYQERNVV